MTILLVSIPFRWQYFRVSPSALVIRALPTLGSSLTCPIVHSSSKSETLVLLIVNWPAVFPRGPCRAQSYTWSIRLLLELSCVARVSDFTCMRATLNCTLAWRPLKRRTLCLHAIGLKFVCVSWHNDTKQEGNTCHSERKRLLLRAITRNINAITPQKCMQWYNHMQTYLPRCLNREEIQG